MRSVSQQRRIARFGLYLIAPFFVWLTVVGYNRSLTDAKSCVVRVVDGEFQMQSESPFDLVIGGPDGPLRKPSTPHKITLTHRATLKLPAESFPLHLVMENDGWTRKSNNVWYQIFASGETQLPYRCEPRP